MATYTNWPFTSSGPNVPGANVPTWLQLQPPPRRATIPLSDYVQQYIYNQTIPFLDPLTQRETALWLSRDDPQGYAAYAALQPHPLDLVLQSTPPANAGPTQVIPRVEPVIQQPPVPVQQVVRNEPIGLPPRPPTPVRQDVRGEPIGPQPQPVATQAMRPPEPPPTLNFLPFNQQRGLLSQAAINYLANALDWNTLQKNLPLNIQTDLSKPENAKALDDILAGTRWLQEALRTASGAVGGIRSQQALAGSHLTTLMREAEQEPLRAGLYTTLFENLMNPILPEAPLSGLFGASRALKLPSGQYRRGNVAFRNPAFT